MKPQAILQRLELLERALARLRARTTFGGGGVPPSAHATTHADGAADELPVTALAGFPGGTSDFLRADGTFATPGAAAISGTIGAYLMEDDDEVFIEVPYAGTIVAARIFGFDTAGASMSGDAVVDVWKRDYANYPPTVTQTITASAKPTLSGAIKAEDTTLTGWTLSFSAGDIFVFKREAGATVDTVLVQLTTVRT